jgi:hypothetical protein
MSACWKHEPEKRPNFETVRSMLVDMLERASEDYGYV